MGNNRTGPDYLDQKPKKKQEPTSMQKRLSEAAAEPGRRGSGTWPDGTSKTDSRYNRDGVRTFGDGTPVTSKNYADFKKNKDKAPKKKK